MQSVDSVPVGVRPASGDVRTGGPSFRRVVFSALPVRSLRRLWVLKTRLRCADTRRMTDRSETLAHYRRLTLKAFHDEMQSLVDLDDRELMLRFYRDGDYVARDLLIAHEVLLDEAGAGINDYAHHVAVQALGGKRIAKPFRDVPAQLRWRRVMYQSGLVASDGRRLQVRCHVRSPRNRRSSGRFALKLDDWVARFEAVLAIVLDEELHVEGAWIVPWDVARRFGGKSLRVGGAWISDPRTEIVVAAS
jgi:hypothetical protein